MKWAICGLLISATNAFSQVSLQQGSATYSIPIFSLSDAKTGLGTSISLHYSSGTGLIVSDKATNTGQGWSLQAGGSITRRQIGEPDDQNSIGSFPVMPYANGRGFNEDIAVYDYDYQSIPHSGDIYSRNYIDNYFPNGFMYSEFGQEMQEMSQGGNGYTQAPRELAFLPRFRSNMDKKWKLSRRALTDRQQDVFLYQFNGISGEFVIGKDGSILPLNDTKIVIDKTLLDLTGQNIRTRISEFVITDLSGTLYKFAAYELSEVMNPVQISEEESNNFRKVVNSSNPIGKFVIQRWLLTEIENPATHEKIIFEYENYNIDIITDKTPSYQYISGYTGESVNVYELRSKGQLKRLKNIIFPDGHKVVLNYATWPLREDVPGDDPITQIKVQYNNEDISVYNLTYGYLVKKETRGYSETISSTEKRFARLVLKEFQKVGTGINEPPYKFSYYTGSESSDPKDIVPPFDCMAQDHWGYYNKAALIDNDLASPSKETFKTLLQNPSIHRAPSAGAAMLGLLKAVENPFGGKLLFEYEQNESKDCDNPTVTKVMGGVRVLRTTLSDGISASNDIVTTYQYKLTDGTSSGWGYEAPSYQTTRIIKIWNASLPDGYTKEGIQVHDINNAASKFLIKQVVNKIASAILTSAGAGQIVTAIGTFNPVTVIAAIILSGLVDRMFVLFNPSDYVTSESWDYLSNQVKNPIGINYSRVEVSNTSVPGGIGKIVNEFRAPANVRSEIPELSLPFSPKQRFAGWKYGLPLRNAVYNQAGNLIKEIINTYNPFVSSPSGTNHKSQKVELTRPESANCYAPSYNFPITDFSWENYYPLTGRAELTSIIEKNYSPTGILLQKNVTSTYNSDYLPKTATTFKSNGDQIIVKTYYPNDYNNISTAITTMKARNSIAIPISTETWLIKPNGNEYLIDATVNQFTQLQNGDIKIEKVYKLETKVPLIKSLIGEQDATVLVRNSTYFKEQMSFTFDNNGILLDKTTPQQQVTTQIYDYNNRVIVAEVSNAARSLIAYSSFETDLKGSWEYNNIYTSTGASVMGKKYFSFPGNSPTIEIAKSLVSQGISYRLSFWTKGYTPTVKNDEVTLNPVKTVLNPISGWTYKEYVFTSSIVPIVYINNPGSTASDIDELRLYPAAANMSTTAYDPKFGKTGECDINNRLLYYEYDGLGRVKHIRDDRQNILKKFCYNYAGETENCLDNSDISQQWRRVGITSCQACSSGNYNSGVLLQLERDMNPISPTYNTYRWTVDPNGSCPTAQWTVTSTYCQVQTFPPYGNTGMEISILTDINPCSPTYNQTQQIATYNPLNCPPTVDCSPPCNTPQWKCIHLTCVQGTWEVVQVVKLGKYGPWECTYAWCYPDGTYDHASSQVVTSNTACSITCH